MNHVLNRHLVKSILATAMALSLVVGLAPAAYGQTLSPTELQLVESWLSKNCGAGEGFELTARLTAIGVRIEAPFLKAFETGPDEKVLAQQEALASQWFRERQTLLQNGEDLGLSQEDLALAQGVDRQSFLKRQREDLILRTRSQALAGLGYVGGAGSERLLRQLAGDPESPFQATAQEALQRLVEREGSQGPR